LLLIRREARQFGWAVSGAHGFFRHGLFGTTTTVFPLFKIQRVDISQTPIQRRRGLAHLTVHLASHSLTMPFMRFEDAAHLRNLALYSAESSQRRWY
jgi:putative membrane protein